MKYTLLTFLFAVSIFSSFSQAGFTAGLSYHLFAKDLIKPVNTTRQEVREVIDPCATWLVTPTTISYATVGDVDVTGNQLTVEASFNRSSLFDNSSGLGKVVSKDTGPTNANYSLFPAQCAVTTDVSGFVTTPQVCLPSFNRTYQVAMVYDGINLKFFRNGFLLSEIPCTGNLITNNLLTTIGQVAGNGYPDSTQFKGYINEVRIWNVARTQAQIDSNMNTNLSNPPAQPGLVAYFVFDSLINKQGNSAYQVTIGGGAATNASNLNCPFLADSCDGVLPVTLTAFETNVTGKQIRLNWNTENEDGIQNYIVERSITGNSGFVPVGTIKAAKSHAYSFVDTSAEINKNYYYRLAILEYNGAISYSAIKVAKINAQNKFITIYPNPTKGTLFVRINGYRGNAIFTVTNSVGEVILRKNELIVDDIPLPVKLADQSKGVYWLKVITDGDKQTERFIIF